MRNTFKKLGTVAALTLLLGAAACTDPSNPGQRAIGGGVLGAGAGAGVAALTGGNAGTGALIGGGLGAVGGLVTTPDRGEYGPNGGYPPRGYQDNGGYPPRGYRGQGYGY